MTASAQEPIANPVLKSTNTAYTTLESLLLFHNLSTRGTHPSTFSAISNLLVKNPLIRESETFDRGRLSPDALREFYLYLLRQETDATVNGLGAKNATTGNGNINGTVGDLVDPEGFTRQMSEKFYNEYKERMRVLIRAEEERFAKLAEEIREIEAGNWDERLLANAGEVSGDHCIIQPSDVSLSLPVDSNHTECTSSATHDVSPEVATEPAVITKPAFPPPLPQGSVITLPLAPVAEDFKRSILLPSTPATEPIRPAQRSPLQSPAPPKSPQSHQSPQQSPLQQQGLVQQQPLHPQHTVNEQNSVPIVTPIQSPQPQLQSAPQLVEPQQPTTAYRPLTDPPIDASAISLSSTAVLPQQLHPSTPRQTLPPLVPHAQSSYKLAADLPHGSPIASTPTSISPQYQQLSQLIPGIQQGHELYKIPQSHILQRQISPQPQFLPVDQSQSVQHPPLSPSRPPSPTSPATPQATSPKSPPSPPQASQLQIEPLRLTLQTTPVPPKSQPKNRHPLIKMDILPLSVPPPERLQMPAQARSTPSLEVQIPKAETSQPARLDQKPFDTEPRTINRPGSPIQPGPDEISPISTPGVSPPPPDFAEFEASTSRKRSFEESNEDEDVKRSPAMESDWEVVDAEEDDHAAKRRKSVAIPVTIPTLTALVAPKPRAMSSSSADRTAAARAASAAKRAAASAMKRGRGGRTNTVSVTTRAPTNSVEPDVKRESDAEAGPLEQDVTMSECLGEEEEQAVEKKAAVRRKKKRKSLVGKKRQSGRKSAMQQEEEKDETADDVSTVESETTGHSTAPEGDEEISDMDVDMEGASTPKGMGPSKRKRYSSTPPPEEAATPIRTASPRLTATPLLPPPPPLIQTKSETSSSSSSLSNVMPQSPSLTSFLLPKLEPIGCQQVQVIATKKFQQLSAPLLHNISAHRFANLFMTPVGERVAPGYSRLVFRPMDLKTIKAAIKNGAAVVNQFAQPFTTNANTSTDPPTTPSTPSSSSFAPTGQGYSSHPATTLITPPKGIVNSAQLEKELFRMFANAVMYNKSNTEIVKETVEMGKEVERWVGEFRSAERVGGERARGGGGAGGGTAAGWRAGPRHSIGSGAVRTESVTSGRGGARKGKGKVGELKEKETKRRQSGRPKKEESEGEAEQEREDDDKMEEDREDEGEGQEDEEEAEAEAEGNGEDDGEDTEEDGDSVAETNEVEADAEDDVDEDDGDADGRSITSSSVAGSTVRGGGGRRGGRGGRRSVKRGKRRR